MADQRRTAWADIRNLALGGYLFGAGVNVVMAHHAFHDDASFQRFVMDDFFVQTVPAGCTTAEAGRRGGGSENSEERDERQAHIVWRTGGWMSRQSMA